MRRHRADPNRRPRRRSSPVGNLQENHDWTSSSMSSRACGAASCFHWRRNAEQRRPPNRSETELRAPFRVPTPRGPIAWRKPASPAIEGLSRELDHRVALTSGGIYEFVLAKSFTDWEGSTRRGWTPLVRPVWYFLAADHAYALHEIGVGPGSAQKQRIVARLSRSP
jgi:hypothetical protein